MNIKVVALPEVADYIDDLIPLLYEKEYFSFLDSSLKYFNSLMLDIENNLSKFPKHQAPTYFRRYGKDLFYSSFPRNKRTTWYVFFTIHKKEEELIYLIRYISNNHVIAKHL